MRVNIVAAISVNNRTLTASSPNYLGIKLDSKLEWSLLLHGCVQEGPELALLSHEDQVFYHMQQGAPDV